MWISTKRKLRDYLSANNIQLIKALTKLILYPYNSRTSDLVIEVHNAAYVCPAKIKCRRIGAKFIYKCLSSNNDLIENLIPIVHEEMSFLETPVVISDDDVRRAIQRYQTWLASELALNGVVTRKQVRDAIVELILISTKVRKHKNKG